MEQLPPGHQNDNCILPCEEQLIYEFDDKWKNLYGSQQDHEKKPLVQC